MNANNGTTMVGTGREISFFLIPAAVLAAFALMLTGVVASLNHEQELTDSIQTVLARPSAPEEIEIPASATVAQNAKR